MRFDLPRSLEGEQEEWSPDDDRRLELEREAAEKQAELSVFHVAGWRQVEATIADNIRRLKNDLAGDAPITLESVYRVRGEIASYEWLLGLRKRTEQRLEQIRGELKAMEETD